MLVGELSVVVVVVVFELDGFLMLVLLLLITDYLREIVSVPVCVRIQNKEIHVLSPAKVAVNVLWIGLVLFVYGGIVKESFYSRLCQVLESFPVLCLIAPIRPVPP